MNSEWGRGYISLDEQNEINDYYIGYYLTKDNKRVWISKSDIIEAPVYINDFTIMQKYQAIETKQDINFIELVITSSDVEMVVVVRNSRIKKVRLPNSVQVVRGEKSLKGLENLIDKADIILW